MCEECYTNEKRITPLRKPIECLQNHTQYICGTCGRCICIQHDTKRALQRWNFPFTSLEDAKLYLRTADYTLHASCGIYELKNDKGRLFFKIFANHTELEQYLKKNKNNHCEAMAPVFSNKRYIEYSNTQVRMLTPDEIIAYMSER